MRITLRLLASVKLGAGRYLEPGSPTGLTGLFTHPSPRSSLLYLYSSTIDKLQSLPEHSVYRQATEALTRQRLRIIDGIRPAGWEEWAKRAEEKVQKHPEIFQPGKSRHVLGVAGGRGFVETHEQEDDELDREWDDEENNATLEGTRVSEEGRMNARMATKERPDQGDPVQWEPEPPLDVSQIQEAENQIGAGLIEEVIQVAEGELKLLDVMLQSKAWEDLEEKPPAGQWEYFDRARHTGETQAPPT
ncbi:MAG: hypothetical protein Q9163_006258 [Psora crenata]